MAIVNASKRTVSNEMLMAARAAMFNGSGWRPVGDRVPLKDLLDAEDPTLWGEIDGDCATIITKVFDDGSVGRRIAIPLKDGDQLEYKLSGKSVLMDGDTVNINDIYGQMIKKAGREKLMRFDADHAVDVED